MTHKLALSNLQPWKGPKKCEGFQRPWRARDEPSLKEIWLGLWRYGIYKRQPLLFSTVGFKNGKEKEI